MKMTTSPYPSRIARLGPSLLLFALASLAGCATTGTTRPPVGIATGETRAPVTPAEPTQPSANRNSDDTSDGQNALSDLLASLGGKSDGGLTPAFMKDREIIRLGILLPFTHPDARVRREADGLLAGAELALFEKGGDAVLLVPKDTRGSRPGAEEAVDAALKDKVDVILGPLFSDNVRTVADKARGKDVPVIAFSNDRRAAGGGAYLIPISAEVEVARMVEYAAEKGADTFAFLGPSSDYGRRAEQALRVEVSRRGGSLLTSEFYDPANEAPVDEAKRFADSVRGTVRTRPGKVAVLIPERGLRLLAVAPLLPYYDVDVRRMTLMGTGVWNDPSIWREPALIGGIFPAPDPANLDTFRSAYTRIYRNAPGDLSGLGYEAAAMAIALASQDRLNRSGVESPSGFIGVNGPFRFRIDGTAERGLAVMQIGSEGVTVAQSAPVQFDTPGS